MAIMIAMIMVLTIGYLKWKLATLALVKYVNDLGIVIDSEKLKQCSTYVISNLIKK